MGWNWECDWPFWVSFLVIKLLPTLHSSSFLLHPATWKADEKAGTVASVLDHEKEGHTLGMAES